MLDPIHQPPNPELDLSPLGLNAYETGVYLALLARSGLTSSEVATRARVPRQRVYDVLQSLESKGLITVRGTAPRTLFPVDPATALPALSARRAAELERERERTSAAALELVAALAPLFHAGREQTGPLQYVEAIADPERIAVRALELAESARTCVSSLVKRPLLLSGEQNRRIMRAPLERGVPHRVLCETEALTAPGLREWMAELGQAGQAIRVSDQLADMLMLFDDQAAWLSMQDPVGGPPSFTALVLRHRGAVALLRTAFERLWEESETCPPI